MERGSCLVLTERAWLLCSVEIFLQHVATFDLATGQTCDDETSIGAKEAEREERRGDAICLGF